MNEHSSVVDGGKCHRFVSVPQGIQQVIVINQNEEQVLVDLVFDGDDVVVDARRYPGQELTVEFIF